MRGARVQYQNPMISYCKTAPDQICRRAPNGSPCQAISRQKSAGRRQIWSGARLRAAEPPAGKVIPDFGTLSRKNRTPFPPLGEIFSFFPLAGDGEF